MSIPSQHQQQHQQQQQSSQSPLNMMNVNPSSPTAAATGNMSSAFPRSGSGGGLLHEREVVRATGRDAISTFLDSHTCYSVLRASGKCVVFDTRIPIQLAFYALVEHGTFCMIMIG